MKIISLAIYALGALPLLAAAGPAASPPADKLAPEFNDPAFRVMVDGAVYPAEAFRAKGFAAETMAAEPENSFAPPEKDAREALFEKVSGLAPAIAEMDALDQDLLFIRAKNYEPAKLAAIYPALDANLLARLQKVLRAGR